MTSNENYKLRTCCVHKLMFLFWHSEQFMYTTCSELVIFMYWTGNSMNNLLSYCGLVDARKSASEKDLPVVGDKICCSDKEQPAQLKETLNMSMILTNFTIRAD